MHSPQWHSNVVFSFIMDFVFILTYILSLGLKWILSFHVFSDLDSIRLSKMLISIVLKI